MGEEIKIKNFENELKEILKDLLYKTLCEEGFDNKIVNQTISAIKKLIIESLPREKYGMGFDLKSYNQGFNQCLEQVKERLG